jgi:hypothetical protein
MIAVDRVFHVERVTASEKVSPFDEADIDSTQCAFCAWGTDEGTPMLSVSFEQYDLSICSVHLEAVVMEGRDFTVEDAISFPVSES